MNNFDDYFEDQSEVEQVIDDAINKLVELISEKTKSEIERYKNWYESVSDIRNKLQKQVYEQAEQIKVLEIDLKRTKEELERKDNEIPKVPFMLGDKVWFIGSDCRNEVVIKCPTCEGKGKVKTLTTEYGEVEITCPHCKGNSVTKYEPAKAYQGYVARSHTILDVADDVPSFIYDLVANASDLEKIKANENSYTFRRYEIYRTKEEAEKAADQETKIRKFNAEKKFLNEIN